MCYRLSRAKRVIENAFGILVARWRTFHRSITAGPKTVDNNASVAVYQQRGVLAKYLMTPAFLKAGQIEYVKRK